jgi:hypothetical protein
MEARRQNPLVRAQTILNGRAPLTFEQLNWPTEEQLSGADGDVYRSSAQYLVDQLLQLPDGPACLRAMLEELPRHLNWQLAFLSAFRAHFARPLDVEKWWALQLVEFTGRDLTQLWSFDESRKKLEELLRSPVQVRTQDSDSPLRSQITLQVIIREWDRMAQLEMLKRKSWELDQLRVRTGQELVSIVDDYRAVLQDYLQKRNASGQVLAPGKKAKALGDPIADDTIRQLDVLDARLESLRTMPSAPTTAAAEPVR